MATNIKLKKSSVAGRIPDSSDLDYGEIAINYTDGKVYYKNSSNEIKAFLDSGGVQSLIDTLEFPASGVDSAAVTSLIDSDYVQLRAVGLDYSALVGTPNILDSNDVAIIAGQLEGLTEASAIALFDSDYVQLRSVGLDYSSLTNTPSVLDSDQVISLIPDATYRGIRKYNYIATAGQDTFADSDVFGNVMAFSHNSNIVVYLNGILLADSDDFAATNDTITLTAPAVADDVLTVHNIQAGGLDSASVIELNNRLGRVGINEISFIADSGQDTFNVSYLPGALLVTLNGIILLNGVDYTATNGSTIVLDQVADSGDTLIVATFGGDSARIETVVDSDYVQLRSIGLDYNLLSNTPSTSDSVSEATNALTLNNQAASYYLDYTNFTNTPNVLDSADVALIVGDTGLDSTAVVGLVDSAYIQARQDYAYSSLTGTPNVLDSSNVISLITATVDVDSSFVITAIDSAIGALIDGAPAALDTLNELAAALNDDSEAYNTLLSQINTKISASDIPTIVDSDYIALRIPTFFDSASVLTIVDSAYIQARQDYAYSSLTGTPNVLDSADVITIAESFSGLDSAEVISLIATQGYLTDALDSAEAIQLITSFGYSTFDSVDAAGVIEAYGYSTFDSAEAIQIINEDYIEARRPAEAIFNVINSGSSAYSFTGDGFPDSADNPTLHLQRGLTYKFNINAVDHPFEIRLSDGGSAYSSGITNNAQNNGELIFTVPMNAPETLVYQCTVHSSMIGNIVLLSDASSIDSAEVISLIATQGYLTDALDSSEVLNLIDSDYIQARQIISGGGTGGTDSATVISLITSTVDSDYIQARQIIGGSGGTGTVDSAYVLSVLSGANQPAATDFLFTADSGQTIFTGLDNNGDSLSFVSSSIQVFLNGILLRQAQDFIDSANNTIILTEGADSGDELTVFSIATKFGLDSTAIVNLIDSDYVNARVVIPDAGVDSATVLAIVATANKAGVSTFEFIADSGDTSVSGVDINGSTLAYKENGVVVYINGVLLREQDYTATDGSSISFDTALDSGSEVTVLSIIAGTTLGGTLSNYTYQADSAETVFSGPDIFGNTLEYATDKIQVYLNGILLIDSVDFAANDGSSIVLTTATDSADYVSIVAGLEGPTSTWREVAESSYTAVANSKLIVDTSTGVVTVTLPGSPEFGDEVKIIDGTGNADSNNITINRNGNKILGADSDFTLDISRVAVDLVYYNTTQGWIISGNS